MEPIDKKVYTRQSMIRFALVVIFFLLFVVPSYAIYDPLSVPNNKFGIHIADPNDIPEAAKLVNSSNGLWGYVTIVIPDNDRDIGKWQNIFKKLKKLALIPIVRLATHVEGGSWSIPQTVDAAVTANFLSDLPWPTKNRYVVLFNEPNHAKEWGNTLDPEGYARTARAYGLALKNHSDEYFILPAGFDASAPNSRETMDEEQYVQRIFASEPKLLELLDGWTSHSYPNPGFSASPYDTGRGTLKTYEWELSLLASIGIKKNVPIFITETGWAHTGLSQTRSLLNPDQVSEYIDIANRIVWNDPRIVAVTPFLFQYPEDLFSMFSWLIPHERTPYPFYLSYQSFPKIKGDPMLPPTIDYLALLREPLSL